MAEPKLRAEAKLKEDASLVWLFRGSFRSLATVKISAVSPSPLVFQQRGWSDLIASAAESGQIEEEGKQRKPKRHKNIFRKTLADDRPFTMAWTATLESRRNAVLPPPLAADAVVTLRALEVSKKMGREVRISKLHRPPDLQSSSLHSHKQSPNRRTAKNVAQKPMPRLMPILDTKLLTPWCLAFYLTTSLAVALMWQVRKQISFSNGLPYQPEAATRTAEPP